ncbi:MAG: hypothetical protein ACTFAL_10045 [Candidatus Electronema sp. V4]|uniref:hypothetical protein n=1 Tax=Candidatus Electronema sp. V4 TaxID=3454756 RepID=UPI0040556514
MRKLIKQSVSAFAGAALLLSAAASFVQAHGTNLWCYVEKGKVYVEGSFMGSGRVLQNGKVIVLNDKEEKILEGVTDKDGKFSFEPPYKGKMTILLKSDESHSADFELTEQDFLDAEAEEKAAAAPAK